MLSFTEFQELSSRRGWLEKRTSTVVQGRIQGGGGIGAMPLSPQDAEVAFWSTAIILIQ